jgi:hypothetical protein
MAELLPGQGIWGIRLGSSTPAPEPIGGVSDINFEDGILLSFEDGTQITFE